MNIKKIILMNLFLLPHLVLNINGMQQGDIQAQQELNANLGIAAQTGNLEEVKELISLGADPLVPSCLHGTTPLLKAAHAGHLAVVKHLVDLGADINELDQSFGRNAFHMAVNQGHSRVVSFLAENGADINLVTENGMTPYHLAYSKTHYHIAELLNEIESANKRRNASAKKLLAFLQGHFNLTSLEEKHAKLLIDGGANINMVKNEFGSTALILSAFHGHKKIVKMLINSHANLDIQNRNGETALILAASGGYKEIVTDLINVGANLNIKDNNGSTALIRALQNGFTEIPILLIRAGADVTIKNKKNKAALDVAQETDNQDIIELIEKP